MTTVKLEVWTDMPNPHNCRNRSAETAERPMSCHENGCGWRGAYRRVKIHWDGPHSDGKQVFAMKCAQDGCMWFCYKNMKCFVCHMKSMHDIKTTSDSVILFTIKIPKNNVIHS